MTDSEAWSNFYEYGGILSFCLRDLDENDACYAEEAFRYGFIDGFNSIKEDYYKNDIRVFYNEEEDLFFTLYSFYEEGAKAKKELEGK